MHTAPDEAAVFLGAATEQATAGLLKAATYRVVSAVPLHTLCTAIACQLLLKINTQEGCAMLQMRRVHLKDSRHSPH